MPSMRRREFVSLFSGAAVAWPFSARSQQPAMPVVGFLSSQYFDGYQEPLRAFRQGLRETGFVEGESVAVEYRWAENQSDRLPGLAAELIRRRVAVMTAMDSATVLAAKTATTMIPIVFNTGEDPVRLGLVASLARPDGNLTGVNFFAAELAAKRLSVLRELVPRATRIALLVNPDFPSITEPPCGTSGQSRTPPGCRSRSSARAAGRRSPWHSRQLRENGSTRCCSGAVRFSPTGVFSWLFWRPITRRPQCTPADSMSKQEA